MDYTAYFRDLADYYNHSRIPSKVMTGAAEIRAEYNQAGSWVQECAESLQAALAKRRVLEVACGSGRWTQFVADVAEHVLATDPCPALQSKGICSRPLRCAYDLSGVAVSLCSLGDCARLGRAPLSLFIRTDRHPTSH
jgi:SAM-dependent methyltransferase